MVKAVNKLMKIVEAVIIVLLSAAVLVIVMQVVWRYAFRTPLGWTEQAARSGFIWTVMLGIPVMFNRNITMSFDVLLEKITGAAHTVIQVILKILGMGFCVYYFIASLQLCISAGGRMVAGMPIPINALYIAQPVCALLLFIVFLKQIVETAQKKRSREVEKA